MKRVFTNFPVLVALAIASAALMTPPPASAQTTAPHPYGLDPYTPSDAMLLRTYGAALVAQTPTEDLAQLDPYKPSDAALLRQTGGAMPLCCVSWLGPGPVISALVPLPVRGHQATAFYGGPVAEMTRLHPAYATAAPAPAAPTAPSGPTNITTLARPQANAGLSIRYGGRTWVSAGKSMSLADTSFERIGEASGFAVYRRPGAGDDMIYVATRNNLVAPFRLSR